MNAGRALQRLLKRLGIEVHRTAPGADYMECAPFGYSTYRPWFEQSFVGLCAQIAPHSEVTTDRLYVLHQLCLRSLHVDGAFAECGVYRGGTAFLLAMTIAEHANRSVELHLFDTFSGMPQTSRTDPAPHGVGDFGDTSLPAVQRQFVRFRDVTFHPGVIPESFAGMGGAAFAFVHVDVDLYGSVRDCCEFFYPRLAQGGAMVFDDYGFALYRDSARRAVDEYFLDKRDRPLVLTTGQCVVVKL